MEYSITASDIAKRIGCDRQDIYSSASYGLLIKKEYYVEITDRPLSWKKDIDLLTEYDNVRKKFLRRCGKGKYIKQCMREKTSARNCTKR